MSDDKTFPALLPDAQDETIAMVRALCPVAETMTDMHVLCCYALVECGGDEGMAAAALVTLPSKIAQACRTRQSRALLRALATQVFQSVGRLKAEAALMEIVADTSASPNSRVVAAQAIIDICDATDEKEVEKQDGTSKELSDMTVAELEKYVEGVRGMVKVGNQIKNTLTLAPVDVHLDQ